MDVDSVKYRIVPRKLAAQAMVLWFFTTCFFQSQITTQCSRCRLFSLTSEFEQTVNFQSIIQDMLDMAECIGVERTFLKILILVLMLLNTKTTLGDSNGGEIQQDGKYSH